MEVAWSTADMPIMAMPPGTAGTAPMGTTDTVGMGQPPITERTDQRRAIVATLRMATITRVVPTRMRGEVEPLTRLTAPMGPFTRRVAVTATSPGKHITTGQPTQPRVEQRITAALTPVSTSRAELRRADNTGEALPAGGATMMAGLHEPPAAAVGGVWGRAASMVVFDASASAG